MFQIFDMFLKNDFLGIQDFFKCFKHSQFSTFFETPKHYDFKSYFKQFESLRVINLCIKNRIFKHSSMWVNLINMYNYVYA